jgi:hypothetical protein
MERWPEPRSIDRSIDARLAEFERRDAGLTGVSREGDEKDEGRKAGTVSKRRSTPGCVFLVLSELGCSSETGI